MRLKPLVLAWVLFLSCFSYSSLAFETKYVIGQVGPNGGTITSVDITQTLIDTQVKQVGDFEETTYTYKIIEDIKEDVISTQQITTTTIESVVTSKNNLQLDSSVSTSGGITDLSHYNTYNDFHTDYQGGSVTFTNKLDDNMTQSEMRTGFDVTAGATVGACENTYGGGCSSGVLDTFTITIRVYDSVSGFDQQKVRTWSVGNTWNTYETTLNIGPNMLNGSSSMLSTNFYGYDTGYWAGYYGPTIADPYINLQYNSLQEVLTTIEQTITNSISSSLETIESQLTKKYSPIVQPGTENFITATEIKIEEPKIELKIDTPNGQSIQFEVKVETNDSGNVEVSMTSSASGETKIAEIKPIAATATTEAKVEIKLPATKTESKEESKSESKSDSKSDNKKEDNKGESKTTTTTVAEAKQKVAERILQQVLAQTDALLINDTKIGLMIALADTENFNKYLAKKQDDLGLWYVDDGIYQNQKQLADPYAVIFNLAQDRLFEQMENEQYKPDFGK